MVDKKGTIRGKKRIEFIGTKRKIRERNSELFKSSSRSGQVYSLLGGRKVYEKFISEGDEREKKHDYGFAGECYFRAAQILSGIDPRAAAKYAKKSEKDLKRASEELEDYDGEYKRGEQTNWTWEPNEKTTERINLANRARQAGELADALYHEAAKRKVRGIESHIAAAVFLVIGVAGLFFLSPNLTGNVIGNTSINTSNIIGVTLFFIGIIGLFFTFKRNK